MFDNYCKYAENIARFKNQNSAREHGERLRMEIAYLNECDFSCLEE